MVTSITITKSEKGWNVFLEHSCYTTARGPYRHQWFAFFMAWLYSGDK